MDEEKNTFSFILWIFVTSELFFRFLHTYELWRWQLFRSILTVITYFCVILLVVLLIAGYYKVDIDSKLAALLNTTLALPFGRVRHNKDCNTVWQIEWIFLTYLSFVAVCLTVVGNNKSVFLHFHLDSQIIFFLIIFGCALSGTYNEVLKNIQQINISPEQ